MTTDVNALLKQALDDEPALPVTAADLARRGRRRGILRCAGGAATGLVLVSGAAAVVFGVASGRDGTERDVAAPAESTAAVSSKAAQTTPDVITARSLPGLVESRGNLEIASVTSQNLDESAYVNLSAGIVSVAGRRADDQYLNVQVFPGEKGSRWLDCYGVSDLDKDGDGYYGPCTVRTLPGGNRLLERHGTTKSGGFAIVQATVVRKDGSGVTAEASNQRALDSHKRSPVVSDRPPVSSAQMAALVRQLAELPVRR